MTSRCGARRSKSYTREPCLLDSALGLIVRGSSGIARINSLYGLCCNQQTIKMRISRFQSGGTCLDAGSTLNWGGLHLPPNDHPDTTIFLGVL